MESRPPRIRSEENQQRLRKELKMGKHRLQTLIEDAGMLPRSYSGRGMHGHECLAIDCDSSKVLFNLAFLLDAARLHPCGALQDDITILADAMRRACTEEIGLGTVIYWPRIKYIEG